MLKAAPDILGIVGTVFLAYPAFSVARYGKILRDSQALAPVTADQDERRWIEQARSQIERLRDAWTPLHGFCLLAGTALTLVGNIVGAILAATS